MTQSDTKNRYTLREVQARAKTYDLLVQSLNANSRAPYGIYFEGQLVAQAKKLVDVVAVLPGLYRAIQEQLAEQQKTMPLATLQNAPAVEDALVEDVAIGIARAAMNVSAAEESVHHPQDTEYCAKVDTVQTLQNPEDIATGNFSHRFYEDAMSWELRSQLNDRGYQDALAYNPPAFASIPYMAGYSRGMRDRPSF